MVCPTKTLTSVFPWQHCINNKFESRQATDIQFDKSKLLTQHLIETNKVGQKDGIFVLSTGQFAHIRTTSNDSQYMTENLDCLQPFCQLTWMQQYRKYNGNKQNSQGTQKFLAHHRIWEKENYSPPPRGLTLRSHRGARLRHRACKSSINRSQIGKTFSKNFKFVQLRSLKQNDSEFKSKILTCLAQYRIKWTWYVIEAGPNYKHCHVCSKTSISCSAHTDSRWLVIEAYCKLERSSLIWNYILDAQIGRYKQFGFEVTLRGVSTTGKNSLLCRLRNRTDITCWNTGQPHWNGSLFFSTRSTWFLRKGSFQHIASTTHLYSFYPGFPSVWSWT